MKARDDERVVDERMIVIGILGGIASGKSLVSQQLVELGATRLDADRVGHEVLREAEVRRALRQRWGETVMAADGQIDRSAVARIVFAAPPAGPEELAYLERITHPRIATRLQQQIAEERGRGVPALVLDAPVLLKAGWGRLCDRILFVDAPQALREQRAAARGWTAAELAAREAAQETLPVKRARADACIDNSGTPEQTRAQVERFWQTHVAAPASQPD